MTFRPNPRFAEELAREAPMRAFLDDVVDEATGHVRALAPVGETGDLKDSIVGDVNLTADGYVGEVQVGVWYWMFPEHRSSYLRAGVLRAVSRRGGRLEGDS